MPLASCAQWQQHHSRRPGRAADLTDLQSLRLPQDVLRTSPEATQTQLRAAYGMTRGGQVLDTRVPRFNDEKQVRRTVNYACDRVQLTSLSGSRR